MKLKKLAVKMFSILLAVILLNTQFVFAARYQDVTEDLTVAPYNIYSGFTESAEVGGSGGVFLVSHTVTLTIMDHVSFSSNAARLFGGAINTNNEDSKVNIGSNASFDNNKAIYGGAINIQKGTVTIGDAAVFKNNKTEKMFEGDVAASGGGAIHNKDNLTIGNEASFEKNVAYGNGGAICNDQLGKLTIGSGAYFNKNESTNGSGGAIYNYGTVNISSDAYIRFGYNVAKYSGGAIYNLGNFSVTGCSQFQYNSSESNGGTIYNSNKFELGQDGAVPGSAPIIVHSSSTKNGGAICNYTIFGKLKIGDGVKLSQNYAGEQGGGIYNQSGTVSIGNDMEFERNSANGSGGAIYNERGTFTIGNNIKFAENGSNDCGGAIYNCREDDKDAQLNIGNDVMFSKNHSQSSGGAIYNDDNLTIGDRAVFYQNYVSQANGGAIYNDFTGKLKIGNDALFTNNSAYNSGGAIYEYGGSSIIGDNAQFIENFAEEKGGAIYTQHEAGKLTIGNNAQFTKNSTSHYGGVIYNNKERIVIGDNAQFTENFAEEKGGVIYSDNYGTISIGNDAQFIENSATDHGGVIYGSMGTVNIGNNAKFIENYTYELGGVVYVNTGGTVNIGDNAEFSQNFADDYGGVIYLDGFGSFGVVNIGNNAKFANNSVDDYSGGAININGGIFNIGNNAEFVENYAREMGGAINKSSGTVTIGNNAYFKNNSSDNYGGAIANEKGKVYIGDNAQFTNNSTEDDGGAIMNDTLGTVTIGSNANFTGNMSNFGGAIENRGIMTFEDGVVFRDNTAEIGCGGAIYNSGTLNLVANTKNVEFTGNTSGGDPIAIDNQKSTMNLWASEKVRFIFNDRITSDDSLSTLNINQSSGTLPTNGTIELNADMSRYVGEVYFYGGTIELGKNGTLFGVDNGIKYIDVDNATIKMANGKVANAEFGIDGSVNIRKELNLTVDADLENKKMDMALFPGSNIGPGKLNVKEINIIKDSDKTTRVDFASTGSDNNVISVNKARSVRYSYDAKLEYGKITAFIGSIPVPNIDGYYYTFTKNGVNPVTASGAISATAGGAATQSLVANQVFANMNGKTSNSKKASINPSNLYVSAGDQVFDNSGKVERGLWLKPFMAQETVKIGDADVDNNLYGTLAGIDFPLGQDKQVSFYLGYAGSEQTIEEVKSNQTGYVLGATGMLIKEKWYLGATANMIFNKASIDSDDGTNDIDMNMFGIAAKAGYNYDMGKKWILEPNVTLMYGIVNCGSYETTLTKVDSQSISNISVEPQVKAKFEIGNGWQPYGLLGYSANLSSQPTVKTEAGDLDLDSVDGYVEYGAGVNKDFIDTAWSCYAQVTGRSGGRNGFAGNLGVKYKF